MDATEAFKDVLNRFTSAVEAGDGEALARLFTADGSYHDGFYGEFVGRPAIATMLEEHFWGHANNFRWLMIDPVCVGELGYARYNFSYDSTLPGVEGRRVVFEGFSQFRFSGPEIKTYREEFNTGMAVTQLGFEPDRIAAHLKKRVGKLLAD